MNKKIVIVSGDPNSINSELIYKCWKKIPKKIKEKIYLISNYRLMKSQFKKLKYKIKITEVKNILDEKKDNSLKIIDVKLNFSKPFNVSNSAASKFVLKSLNLAHNLALNRNVAGIINCPINKDLLKKNNIGVTELLASKCKIKDNSEVMIIKSKTSMVTPITTHKNIKSISRLLNKRIIKKKIFTINTWFKKKFNKKPKIAVLGLNPHNAELKKNSEEKKTIIPAINELKKLNFKIDGPLVADTIFINNFKNYDIIVGMYHDQVLAPFKALFKFDAINITLGLKYIRVSPDHGVAKNNIMKKKSNYLSLLNCINYLNELN